MSKPATSPIGWPMRAPVALCILLVCQTPLAHAQVSVDMRALEGVGGGPPAARVAPQRPAAPVAGPIHPVLPPRVSRTRAPEAPVAANSTSVTPAKKPAAPDKDTASPPTAVTGPGPAATPPPPLPTAQPALPPPVTTVPVQQASPAPLPPPVRLLFEGGKTELTAGDEAAIRDLAHAIPMPDVSSINVVAYAAGKPDDPSTARRLSLSRGMAVRSVLMDSGVPSAQIYVRALGATPSDGPADRVELIVARIGTVTR